MKIIFFLLILCIGCASNHTNKKKQSIICYFEKNELKSIDTTYFELNITDTLTYYLYKKNSGSILEYISIKADDDSSLNYSGEKCKLLQQKPFYINGETFFVSKYLYDIENSHDEEAELFFHKKYGLLVIRDIGWYYDKYTFETDSVSTILIDSILEDLSGFYDYPEEENPPPIENNN